jgi:AcrR family transcriptional regulator
VISAPDADLESTAPPRERAKPLATEDRRNAILDAVIPLLKERGQDVSTRHMAEAARVAEGTLFRAFGDKESIITAAVARYFDPEPFRDALRHIDPEDPPADKVRQVFEILRERFAGIVGFSTALGLDPRAKSRTPTPEHQAWMRLLPTIFRPGELTCDPVTLGFYLRLVAFGTAIPPFYEVHPFETDEVMDLVIHGVIPIHPESEN